MKKPYSLLLLALACLLFSCSKNATNVTPVASSLKEIVDGRMAFSSAGDFTQYAHMLNDMKQEDLDKLAASSNFASLNKALRHYDGKEEMPAELSSLDTAQFPKFLRFILNANGEVLIGDSISWFGQGKQFFIHKNDVAELEHLKKDPGNTRSIVAHGGIIPAVIDPNAKRIGINAGADGRHQKEFYAVTPTVRDIRKFVVESYAYTLGTECYLIMRIKLEWRSRKGWKPAGEPRAIFVNVVCNSIIYDRSNDLSLYGFTGNYDNIQVTTSSDYELSLGAFNNVERKNIEWDLNVHGSMFLNMVDDVEENIWYLSGSLWYQIL